MYKSILFWFTLSMGILFLWVPFGDLGIAAFHFLPYHVAGLLIGLILGWGVFMHERTRWSQKRQKRNNSAYKTTALPEFIFLLLNLLFVLSNNKWDTGYTVALSMALASYLLILAAILRFVRNNEQIVIR